MSKGGSRYGRRSNWFKIHCLLQEQQQQALDAANKAAGGNVAGAPNPAGFGDMAAAAAAAAKQHMQTLNPHMAAASGFLGYPGYHLPEMIAQAAPFMSAAARHPAADATFFNMMNSLPNMGAAQSAFQLPPHLLFPAAAAAAAYHPNAAVAAAAAADAAYRTEMYKHRQSVESAGSSDSAQCYTPQRATAAAAAAATAVSEQHMREEQEAARHSPELCVSGGDEDEDDELDVHSPSPATVGGQAKQQIHQQIQVKQQQHEIHSPIAIRASALSSSPLCVPVPASAQTPNSVNLPTHQPSSPAQNASAVAETAALSFAAKMQSLSPVSVCSIGAESMNTQQQHSAMDAQDGPMDLSMKPVSATTRASTRLDAVCDMNCDLSEEEAAMLNARRKYFHYNSDHSESDTSSDGSSAAAIANKRQKLIDEGYNSAGYASSHGSMVSTSSATSMHGIFVCV